MLSLIARITTAAAATALFAAGVGPASAQYYGFGGVRVSTPGVGVSVSPYGGVSVRAPGAYVRTPGRVYAGPRRVYRGGYYYGGGYYGGTNVTVTRRVPTPGGTVVAGVPTAAAQPATAAVAAGFATEAELGAMTGEQLLATLNSASAVLDARLDGFVNGEGWQKYFVLEAAATGDLATAERMLARFDSVARDAQFAMIATLDEFAAVRTTLRVLVDRGGVVAEAAAPASTSVRVRVEGESLPLPEADVDVDVNAGGVGVKVERSVLKGSN